MKTNKDSSTGRLQKIKNHSPGCSYRQALFSFLRDVRLMVRRFNFKFEILLADRYRGSKTRDHLGSTIQRLHSPAVRYQMPGEWRDIPGASADVWFLVAEIKFQLGHTGHILESKEFLAGCKRKSWKWRTLRPKDSSSLWCSPKANSDLCCWRTRCEVFLRVRFENHASWNRNLFSRMHLSFSFSFGCYRPKLDS